MQSNMDFDKQIVLTIFYVTQQDTLTKRLLSTLLAWASQITKKNRNDCPGLTKEDIGLDIP
jgi:hypothetical protein